MPTRPGATTCCTAGCSAGWRHGRSKPSTARRVGGRRGSPSTCSDRPRWRSWRSTCDRFEPAGASRSPTHGCVATVTTSGERRRCSWPRATSRPDGSGGLSTSRGPIPIRSRRPRPARPTTTAGGSGSCGAASALVSKPGSGPGRRPASSTTSQCRRSCPALRATSRVRSPTAATRACTTSTPTTRCSSGATPSASGSDSRSRSRSTRMASRWARPRSSTDGPFATSGGVSLARPPMVTAP